MLASAIFFFEVLENGSIPLTHGDWLHGAFFHHLHRLNPSLADELHASGDSSFPKPFSIGPLFSEEFELDRRSTLHAKRGATGWFRIGSLHAELTRSLEALQACDASNTANRVFIESYALDEGLAVGLRQRGTEVAKFLQIPVREAKYFRVITRAG